MLAQKADNMQKLDHKLFTQLENKVKECAAWARAEQKKVKRNFKEDGSVLTEVDLGISSILEKTVTDLFPTSSFVCEESPVIRKEASPFTFVLDPIDGTDIFSQGMASFAVALGILDEEHRPVGAIIAAPRFGVATQSLFLSLEPGKKLKVNGRHFEANTSHDDVDQIMMPSQGLDKFDFSAFDGKVRTFGSSIIHLISPVIFSSITGCINQRAYVWDIAASHAVLLNQGMVAEYADGSPIIYSDDILYEKQKIKDYIYAGRRKTVDRLRTTLPLKR